MFKLIFEIIPYFFALLLMVTYVAPAKFKVRAQAIWAMGLLLSATKFYGYAVFGGDAFNPELPMALIWAWNGAYTFMCLLLALSAPWALVLFFARSCRRAEAWRRHGRVLLPVAAGCLAVWGLYNGIKVPEVVEVTVESPRVPADLDGYRILQLTDTHTSAAAPRWRTMALVTKVNAAQPDLIVFTGDIVDGRPSRQARNVQPYCGLRAKDGVWFVTGNHEYYGDWWGWLGRYRAWGFRFLDNAWTSPRPGLVIAGVPDLADNENPLNARFGAEPSINTAFAHAPREAFRILLQHRPYVNYALYGETVTEKFDLQLSGHTHGGVAPGLRALVKAYNHGFVRGFYDLPDAARLYVSPGAGQWAGFPVRFLDDPEITVFTLRRKVPAEGSAEK